MEAADHCLIVLLKSALADGAVVPVVWYTALPAVLVNRAHT